MPSIPMETWCMYLNSKLFEKYIINIIEEILGRVQKDILPIVNVAPTVSNITNKSDWNSLCSCLIDKFPAIVPIWK